MNRYIVALQVGGLMESPEIYYANYQIVNAYSKTEAVRIYNETNKCHFFYGDVVGVFRNNGWKILDNKITKHNLQSFLYTLKQSSPQMLCEASYKENCWHQKLLKWFKNRSL